jgi:hypothetical protein
MDSSRIRMARTVSLSPIRMETLFDATTFGEAVAAHVRSDEVPSGFQGPLREERGGNFLRTIASRQGQNMAGRKLCIRRAKLSATFCAPTLAEPKQGRRAVWVESRRNIDSFG